MKSVTSHMVVGFPLCRYCAEQQYIDWRTNFEEHIPR